MDADRRIGVAVGERLRHRRIHGAGERVLLVRPVHADHLHRAAPFDDDCSVMQWLPLRRFRRSAGAGLARLSLPPMTLLQCRGLAEQVVGNRSGRARSARPPRPAQRALRR